jgi:hypothetical protein
MKSPNEPKNYGTLSVIRGGQRFTSRTKAPVYSDWKLDDEMLAAFEGWHGESGTVPSRAVADIRMGQQRPWRYLAKRFREARAANVPKDQVIAVVKTLELFVSELYQEPHSGRAA